MLDRGRPSKIASLVGAAVLLVGIALPSSLLFAVLGVAPADSSPLWLGATLFRLGMTGLGIYLMIAGRLPIWGLGGQRPHGADTPRPRWSPALAAVILLVALGLRLHQLGVGLWYDEINAQVLYMDLSFGKILTTYESESQHFLFTLLARAAFAIFGEGPAALRLPAALFGAASVGALYLLGRRVTTEREALLSAALLSVSYHHVWFSQNARGYTALLFWTLLSSWLFLRGLEERRSGFWIGYAVSVALGAFAHATMLFAVLAHALVYMHWLVRSRRIRTAAAWDGGILGFGLAGLLTFQLYALVVPQFSSTIGMKARVADWTNPLWTLLELARGLSIGFAGSAVAVVAALVFGVGCLSFARTAPTIIAFFLLPMAIAVPVVLGMGHPLWPRFFFFLMGFGVLMAVRGALVVGTTAARLLGVGSDRATLAGTAVGILLITASALTVPKAWLPKQDYVGARGFIESQRLPGDSVVTVGLASYPYDAFYRTGWEIAENLETLNAIRARAKRTWLVYTLPMQVEASYPGLLTVIRRDFTLIRSFAGTLNGGAIYVCRADAPSLPVGTSALER